jgi:hypothetical protein
MYATIFAIWTLIHPLAPTMPDAPAIAAAIESAVSSDPVAPFTGSREGDAAVLAYYALRESWLTIHAVGDGGRSCGVVQLRCEWTTGLDVAAQVKLWLRLVHASSLGAVDSSKTRAAARQKRALALLAKVQSS